MRRTVAIAGGVAQLFGTQDQNVKLLESSLGVTTQLTDDDQLVIEGAAEAVEQAAGIVGQYNEMVREGRVFRNGEVLNLFRVATQEPAVSLRSVAEPVRHRAFGRKSITAKSPNQRRYMECIEKYDMVFAIGPGGTGKTYLAVAMAVSALLTKQVTRIILARPAVEAGERLGFLPGTLQQKVDPYMRPLYDALYDMLDADKLERYLEKGIIEVAPLAFMRGRTLANAFVVLDEAQNATTMQMKMSLTRLGEGSRMVVTGDRTQIDLPKGTASGLADAERILKDVKGVSFNYFTAKDVVRHPLVARIIEAYDRDDGAAG